LLAEALPHIAHPQIRTRGTVGGSLAHADPAAELPAVMVALGATFELQSPRGRRSVPAEEFYTGLFTTALAPDELLVEIAIPDAADAAASKDVDPPGDIHASAAYRRQLVGVLVRRTLQSAFERARNH